MKNKKCNHECNNCHSNNTNKMNLKNKCLNETNSTCCDNDTKDENKTELKEEE